MSNTEEYARAIEELGLMQHLRLKGDDTRGNVAQITDAILKSVFYSKPYSHRHTASSMLTNGHIDDKDGTLQDYVQMLNMGELAVHMDGFFDRRIDAEAILGVRKLELKSAMGVYSWNSFRAWRVKVGREGTFMSAPETEVKNDLERIAEILNQKMGSEAEVVVNAANFFLSFIRLHPFDEGNGRTGRIMMNTYLLKHGLKQSLVTKEPEDNYTNLKSTDLFSFSGYSGAFVSWVLTSMIGKEKMERISDGLGRIRTENPYALFLRDSMLLSVGKITREELSRDIDFLYEHGKKENINFIHAALWLAWRGNVDSQMLAEAVGHPNQKVRAVAVHAMEGIDFEKYRYAILDVAYSGSVLDRIAAIGILGRHQFADDRLMHMVFDRNSDFGVNCAIGVYLRNINSSNAVDILWQLADHPNKNLRVRGYHAIVAYGSEEDAIEILENRLKNEPREIIKATIEEVSRTGRINSSEKIAEKLSGLMMEDRYICYIVLGELSNKDTINPLYAKTIDSIIRSGRFSDADRAFALYLVGREKGLEHLRSEYGIDFGNGNSTLTNTALALVHANDIATGRSRSLDALNPTDDERFNFVIALIVARSGLDKDEILKKLEQIDDRQVQTRHSKGFYDIIPSLIDSVRNNGNGIGLGIGADLKGIARGQEAMPKAERMQGPRRITS